MLRRKVTSIYIRKKEELERERKLKVYSYYRAGSRTGYKIVSGFRIIPRIILQGDWLKAAGFDEEDDITVSCRKGRLTIKKTEKKPLDMTVKDFLATVEPNGRIEIVGCNAYDEEDSYKECYFRGRAKAMPKKYLDRHIIRTEWVNCECRHMVYIVNFQLIYN